MWFVLLYDLLALGVVAAFDVPDAGLTALLLANPASALRVLVLQSLGTTAGGGVAAALAGSGLSAPTLLAALLGWGLLSLGTGVVFVRRRRL